MKKIYSLIFKTFFGPFVITFFVSLFILVMQFLWVYIDDMVGKGLEMTVILELLFFASANLVPMALPLAVLLSSIMTFGNLGEHYELVALKSSGLSLQRIMSPLIVFMVMLCIGAFVFSNNVWPVANLKFASLLYDIRSKKPALDIKDKAYYKDIDGFVIRVKNRDEQTDMLHDVLIYDHTDNRGNNRVIRAKKGKMSMSEDQMTLTFVLEQGNLYDELEGDKFPLYRSSFEKKTIRFDLSDFKMAHTDEDLFKNNYKMMTIDQLSRKIDTLKMKMDVRTKDFHKGLMESLLIVSDSLKLDKPLAAETPNLNHWFDSLPKHKKIQYINWALNSVRSTNTYAGVYEAEHKSRLKTIRRHEIEWHRKFTLSFACLILFFIGAPLGAIIRKGGLGMPTVISVLLFIAFHIASISGEKMVKQGQMTPWIGMWMASLALTPVGIFLTYKATTDSVILDSEFYRKLVGKLIRFRWISNWVNRGKKES
ncbi:LptF/LptG family permease [bacterium SCSIO 12741]|nr:LptF/LptG family permease [bacterium SCSIO 12741]